MAGGCTRAAYRSAGGLEPGSRDIHRSVKGHWIYDCLLMFIHTFIDWFYIWYINYKYDLYHCLPLKDMNRLWRSYCVKLEFIVCFALDFLDRICYYKIVLSIVLFVTWAMPWQKNSHNQLFVSLQNQNLSLQEKMKEFMKRKSTIALRLLKEMCYATAAGFQQEVFSSWVTWLEVKLCLKLSQDRWRNPWPMKMSDCR